VGGGRRGGGSPPQIEEAAERGEEEQARRGGGGEPDGGRHSPGAAKDLGFGGEEGGEKYNHMVVREVVESLVAQVDLIRHIRQVSNICNRPKRDYENHLEKRPIYVFLVARVDVVK